MEWWVLLSGIFLSVIVLLSLGIPVAFTFFLINIVGAYFLQGGAGAFPQLILSIQSSISSFSLLPIPLFVLMGEILWHSKIASRRWRRSTGCSGGCRDARACSRPHRHHVRRAQRLDHGQHRDARQHAAAADAAGAAMPASCPWARSWRAVCSPC